MNDGYVQFNCKLVPGNTNIAVMQLADLNRYRRALINMGVIGKIPGGPGFGNISVRYRDNQFFITGTNTGHIKELSAAELSLVTRVDIAINTVYCTGEIQASSESMSHFAVYCELPAVNAVVHIHHRELWNYYLHQLPTTLESATYGTPEMAREITAQIKIHPNENVLVLGGHADGILIYGSTPEQCYGSVLKLFTLLHKKTDQ